LSEALRVKTATSTEIILWSVYNVHTIISIFHFQWKVKNWKLNTHFSFFIENEKMKSSFHGSSFPIFTFHWKWKTEIMVCTRTFSGRWRLWAKHLNTPWRMTCRQCR